MDGKYKWLSLQPVWYHIYGEAWDSHFFENHCIYSLIMSQH